MMSVIRFVLWLVFRLVFLSVLVSMSILVFMSASVFMSVIFMPVILMSVIAMSVIVSMSIIALTIIVVIALTIILVIAIFIYSLTALQVLQYPVRSNKISQATCATALHASRFFVGQTVPLPLIIERDIIAVSLTSFITVPVLVLQAWSYQVRHALSAAAVYTTRFIVCCQ
ncbi:hypothetical protein NLG97_g3027 [Lecanicillium saksenae]|uniref:Uncharacterized protein n=1 Tax=Lecanicillium saksenae TaxID=468837 RepID=A0ACC1R0P3_9HYPO|nr:hypothetical protein NLG97_g3027 [Lecanicillium saksenae]